MKLVLTENIRGLGNIGDIVTVKNGYGRNYLLPKNLAAVPREDVVKKWQKERGEYLVRESDRIEAAKLVAEKMNGLNVTMKMKANEAGLLFGSVNESVIAEAVSREVDMEVDSHAIILLSPFKRIGEYSTIVRLHSEVEVEIALTVVKEESEGDAFLDGEAETSENSAQAGDAEASDAEAGDAEAGDAEAGDAEAGDAEAGDAEAGDADGGEVIPEPEG